MDVREIMTRDFQSVMPNASIREAAQMMRDLNVGMLPVADGDNLQGTITDRDLAVRAVADGADPTAVQVQQVMTRDCIYAYEDEDVREAARKMEEHQVRRLLVFNRQDRAVGIIAQADIARDPESARYAGEILHDISEPGPAHRPSQH